MASNVIISTPKGTMQCRNSFSRPKNHVKFRRWLFICEVFTCTTTWDSDLKPSLWLVFGDDYYGATPDIRSARSPDSGWSSRLASFSHHHEVTLGSLLTNHPLKKPWFAWFCRNHHRWVSRNAGMVYRYTMVYPIQNWRCIIECTTLPQTTKDIEVWCQSIDALIRMWNALDLFTLGSHTGEVYC